jgi:hypothetical protein
MSNIINLTWDGAEDDNGISYYELQWRISTLSPWSDIIQVPHNPNYGNNTSSKGGGFYSYTVTELVDHYFRIRIVDNMGKYSTYKEILGIVDKSVILISEKGLNTSDNVCILSEYTPKKQIILKNSDGFTTNSILINNTFVKNSDGSSTFDGSGMFWRILLPAESQGGFLPSIRGGISYSCEIDSDGKITAVTNCSLQSLNEGFRSSNGFNSISSNLQRPDICSVTANTKMYYTSPMEINTIIYSNLERDRFDGSNLYYSIVVELIYYIVRIENGKVSEIKEYFEVCPIPVTNSGSDSCCFVKGTKISMFDNTIKNIEDVKVGDIVITYNEETKEKEPGEVKNTISPLRSDIIEYKLSNDVIIKSTSCHPYFVVDKGWSSFNPELTKNMYDFDVSKIEENDKLLDINDNELFVSKITELMCKKVNTYNLQILGNHTYYANGVLVHNKDNEPRKYDVDGLLTAEWRNWYSSNDVNDVTKTQCWSDSPFNYGQSGSPFNY